MASVPQVLLSDDPGDVDGTFNSTGFNNPTEYTKFTIEDLTASAQLASGAELTPKGRYRFTLGVEDQDTLNDLVSIQFHFYYVTFDENAVTNDEGTRVVVEWNKGDDAFVITDGGVTTTWSISNSAIPALNQKSGDFVFELTVSKVARFTTEGAWSVGLVVVDGDEAEGYDPKAVTHSAIGITSNGDPLTVGASSFNMDWYGEIDITENSALWDSVFPNMDFDDLGALVTLSGIKYISNGSYDREIKANDIWNISGTSGTAAADGSTSAALTSNLENVGADASSTSAQQFALKVADQDSPELPSGTNGVIPEDEATIAFATDKVFTFEAGVTIDVYLWLAISSRFQNATYTGNIILSVVNTVPNP
jgi:hypothetical protein